MIKIAYLFLLLTVSLFIGCSKEVKTPEALVKLYVEKQSSNKVTKKFFLENSSGEFRDKIDAMTDEEFEKYKNVANINKVKVKIINTTCREETCSVKYIISYNVYTKSKNSFKTEVKKLAKVVKEDGKWKLADITNLKTYHESKEAISVGPESNRSESAAPKSK